jgi:hypothetical protein
MDAIDFHERLSELVNVLDERESQPDRPFWFVGDDADQSELYCYDCVMLEKPNGEYGEDYDGGFCCEEDGCEVCGSCSKLLQYTLTNYGVAQELAHFVEYGFDWDSPDECYALARVAHGIYEDSEQSRQLYEVLITGRGYTELATA